MPWYLNMRYAKAMNVKRMILESGKHYEHFRGALIKVMKDIPRGVLVKRWLPRQDAKRDKVVDNVVPGRCQGKMELHRYGKEMEGFYEVTKEYFDSKTKNNNNNERKRI
jgi:hypothetical protein